MRRPIAKQEADYNCKGFLPLDDALVRLKYTDFSNIYFNGYWTNGFGVTPHVAPSYTNTDVYTNILTEAPISSCRVSQLFLPRLKAVLALIWRCRSREFQWL